MNGGFCHYCKRYDCICSDESRKTYQQLRDENARQKETFLFDLDGTLALKGERNPFDWSRVGEDQPNMPVVFVARHLQLFATIVIVSGRDEECRWQSEMWLHAQGIFFHQLFMRPHKDNRPDYKVKKDIYLQAIQPCYRKIMGVFDDRLSVLKAWQELGVYTFDVNNGRGEF